MKACTLFPLLAMLALSGCNYDLTREASGNGGGSSVAPVATTESSPETVEATGSTASPVEPEPVAEASPAPETVKEPEAEAACDPCASERTIDLAWMPQAAASGYRVYFGPSEDAIDQLLGDLSGATPEFDPGSPAISYHAWYDMGLFNGDAVCFSIESYDVHNNTTQLGAACGVINA